MRKLVVASLLVCSIMMMWAACAEAQTLPPNAGVRFFSLRGWWNQVPPTSYGYGPYGYGLPYGYGYWPEVYGTYGYGLPYGYGYGPEVYGTYGYGPLLGPAPYMFSTLLRPLEWVSPYEMLAPDQIPSPYEIPATGEVGSELRADVKEIREDVDEIKMDLDKLLEMEAKKRGRVQSGRALLDSDLNE